MVWRLDKDPWKPADYDDQVIYAVRAMKQGLASDGQQKLVWAWMEYVTGIDDMEYRPGATGDRDTAFAQGKRFVGHQFRKMLHPVITPKPKDQSPTKRK